MHAACLPGTAGPAAPRHPARTGARRRGGSCRTQTWCARRCRPSHSLVQGWGSAQGAGVTVRREDAAAGMRAWQPVASALVSGPVRDRPERAARMPAQQACGGEPRATPPRRVATARAHATGRAGTARRPSRRGLVPRSWTALSGTPRWRPCGKGRRCEVRSRPARPLRTGVPHRPVGLRKRGRKAAACRPACMPPPPPVMHQPWLRRRLHTVCSGMSSCMDLPPTPLDPNFTHLSCACCGGSASARFSSARSAAPMRSTTCARGWSPGGTQGCVCMGVGGRLGNRLHRTAAARQAAPRRGGWRQCAACMLSPVGATAWRAREALPVRPDAALARMLQRHPHPHAPPGAPRPLTLQRHASPEAAPCAALMLWRRAHASPEVAPCAGPHTGLQRHAHRGCGPTRRPAAPSPSAAGSARS